MTVIINPAAGGRHGVDRARRRADLAMATLGREGVRADVFITERAGHARDLAAQAVSRGAEIVFAWGGDGTVNEVATALVRTETALAIIPGGSGNGLARGLGIHRRPVAAIRAALAVRDALMDAGELAGRLFFNVAGIGFDAHVARLVNEGALRRRGLLPYVRTVASELFSYEPVEYEVHVERETIRRRAVIVALANSQQYGYGARLAPGARIDDGRLDLVMADARPPLQMLWRCRRLFIGSVADDPGILVRPVRQATISSAAPMLVHTDGEPAQAGRTIDARVHPSALRVRSPALAGAAAFARAAAHRPVSG